MRDSRSHIENIVLRELLFEKMGLTKFADASPNNPDWATWADIIFMHDPDMGMGYPVNTFGIIVSGVSSPILE